MRKLVPLLIVLGVAVLPARAQTYYFSPDVPTDLAGATYLPWEVVRKDAPGVYAVKLSLPFGAAVDSAHAMCSGVNPRVVFASRPRPRSTSQGTA